MSKSMVEQYEQALASDPSSTAFVELARAYLDRGENEKAIAVCQKGIGHHPDSVVGRVLWGKALIGAGRPAEAMRQFDEATSLDRDDPYAYTLIGEALLRKGLYRSAIPILRKACALRPDEPLLTQWLEQAKAALAGGPPPVLTENPLEHWQPRRSVSVRAPSAAPSAPKAPEVPWPSAADAPPAPRPLRARRDPVPVEPPSPPPADEQGLEDQPTQLISGDMARAVAWAQGGAAPPAPDADLPVVVGREPPSALPAADTRRDEALPAAPVPLSASARRTPVAAGMRAAPAPAKLAKGLLDDIPDAALEEQAPATAAPELNPHAAEAIAREYERELKAKIAATQQRTFLQRHGSKVALMVAGLVVLGAAGGSYWFTRERNDGETLDSALAKGVTALAADTKEQYAAAIKAFERAEAMDTGNVAAAAGAAYAHAMLFAEHGQEPPELAAARLALTASARSAQPEVGVVVDYLTALGEEVEPAERTLLDGAIDKSLVHAHAGRLLLRAKRFDEALTHLKRATELDPRQTLALVALGDYYLAFEDWESALEMMARAEALSRYNPERVLGHAEARLELGRELPEALSALQELDGKASLMERQKSRYALLLGRALSANGRHEEARKVLTDGLATWGPSMRSAFEFALAQAARAAGHVELAVHHFDEALKASPKSEAAKEGLGRALLALGRERELLERLKAEKDQPRVALVRGIACFRLNELARAREEFARTQVGSKYPSEAALYLSLADAAEQGPTDHGVELLEKLAQGKARQRSVAQLALARVYLQRKQLEKARVQLEEAAKDPQDFEANALLGQMLLDTDAPPELTIEPLRRAVDRNGDLLSARQQLLRTLLAAGHTQEAVKRAQAWTTESPALADAWRASARAHLEAGKLAEAQAAAAKLPATSDDPETWRVKARVLFAVGDPQGAMLALQRANKLNVHSAETFCEIGHAMVRQGEPDSAVRAYAKVAEEDPKSACGKAGPYHAHPGGKGRTPPKELLTALVAHASNAWERAFLQATLARVSVEEHDLKGAQTSADAAVATAPFHPAAWFALAEVARRVHADDKLQEALTKAAALDGSWAAPHLALADLLAKQGGDALPAALREYEIVTRVDQNEAELAHATKAAATLRRQLQK